MSTSRSKRRKKRPNSILMKMRRVMPKCEESTSRSRSKSQLRSRSVSKSGRSPSRSKSTKKKSFQLAKSRKTNFDLVQLLNQSAHSYQVRSSSHKRSAKKIKFGRNLEIGVKGKGNSIHNLSAISRKDHHLCTTPIKSHYPGILKQPSP